MDAEAENNLRKIELIDFDLPHLSQSVTDSASAGIVLNLVGGAAIWSGSAAGEQWDGFGAILEIGGYGAGGISVGVGCLAIMGAGADTFRYVRRWRELHRLD